MFHWDSTRGVLCVATKRSLLLYRYDDARGDFTASARDLAVPERVQCVGWAGDSLCLGFRREYVLLNIATGTMSEVFPTGRAGAPSALALPPSELLLTRDAVGVAVGPEGKATRGRGCLAWSEPPCALASAPPFAAALLPRGIVEVRSLPSRGSLAAASSHSAAPLQSLPAPAGAHTLVGAPGGWLFTASSDSIQLLLPIPLAQQASGLAERGAFQQALALCDAMTEAAAAAAAAEEGEARGEGDGSSGEEGRAAASALRCDLHRRYGLRLFADGAYTEAMTQFQAAGGAVVPTQVLALYPLLLPAEHPHARAPGEAQLQGARLAAAQAALLPYLASAREAAWQQRRAAAASSGDAGADHTLSLLDTASVRVMLAVGADSEQLLRLLILPNAVDLPAGEALLSDAGKHTELVALYRSHGEHRRALELLRRLGRAASGAAAASSTGTASPFGPRALVEYLLAMKPQDAPLLLEFSVCVLAERPEEALQLFTRAQPPLPSAAVLPHLRRHAPQLCAPYLEAELGCRGDSAPQEFHNALVLLRQEAVTQERAAAAACGATWEEASRSAARVALLGALGDPRLRFAPERLLSRFPGTAQHAERALLLRRLGRHRDALLLLAGASGLGDTQAAERYADDVWLTAQQMRAGTTPPPTPPEGEAPEQDVYLTLLQVYLEEAQAESEAQGESEGAEGGGGDRAGDDDGDPLAPPQPHSRMLAAALQLLSRRAERVDGCRALALLPATLPLRRLLPFFEGALLGAREARRGLALQRALRRRENLGAREALALASERHVLLNADRLCALCPGRIGGAVFAVFPDNRVVHYTCYIQERERSGRT